jgi:hypothetical protein
VRPINPFNLNELPTFLPGDKVRDVRDHKNKIWRITRRVAYRDSELITLRDVDNRKDVRTHVAKDLIPYLEMVAQRIEPDPAPTGGKNE